MKSFLLVYNRRTGALDYKEYSGPTARKRAFAGRLSRELSKDVDVEIVVLSADSLDELKRTHGRYFSSARDLVRGAVHHAAPTVVIA